MINCAGYLERSRVNGPGERAVIWVQGCLVHCPGCFNRELWSFRKNTLVDAGEMARRILSIPGLDGVTFSGGEPFCQPAPLALLGRLVREEGLSVVTFSGYSAKKIFSSRRADWKALLGVTDILVAGPYVEGLPGTGSLRGSSNQDIVALPGGSPLVKEQCSCCADIEFTIGRTGEITATGFPPAHLLAYGRGGA